MELDIWVMTAENFIYLFYSAKSLEIRAYIVAGDI